MARNSSGFILVTTDDKNDPIALTFADLGELDSHMRAQGIQPGDPRYVLVQGGKVVQFHRPPAPLVIGDPKKPRAPRSDKGTKRARKEGAGIVSGDELQEALSK